MASGREISTKDGPWNPGIVSRLPAAARPLVTIFRPEHSALDLKTIDERSAFAGMAPEDLTILKPDRLVLHELLLRVTCNITVPAGNRTADLGINFRNITDHIWHDAIEPRLAEIRQVYADLAIDLRREIEIEIDAVLTPPAPPAAVEQPGFLARLLGAKPPPPPPEEPPALETCLQAWREEYRTNPSRRRQRVCRALARTINNIAIRHGRLVGDRTLLTDLALGLAMNDHGGVTIGRLIEDWVKEAAIARGYRLLPAQKEPVILNTKGASAAGKSTLRPLQEELASRIGVDWQDFALISPDIWRKYLLDYDSLGEFYRYAGMLTGEEIRIIDQKLDRYMAGKAAKGWMSHLLIDRFRFDSFAEIEEAGLRPKLLTRFGSIIHMFFVITPPEATVERAWYRGLEFGRFKAVDDLLHHNVEAFTGMPELFFTWATHADKTVYFEFLDNSVPFGQPPRTVAFGRNGEMVILDLKCLLDIDRFRKINIDATSPEEVYQSAGHKASEWEAECNTGFIEACIKRIPNITVAEPESGRCILQLDGGVPSVLDRNAIELLLRKPDLAPAVRLLLGGRSVDSVPIHDTAEYIDSRSFYTLGVGLTSGGTA